MVTTNAVTSRQKSVLLSVFVGVIAVAAAMVTPTPAQGVCDGVPSFTQSNLQLVDIVTGLDRPLLVTSPPGDVDRLFIVEQQGLIKIYNRGDDATTTSVFLDLTTQVNDFFNEQGLLGLAFDPDFDNNGYFYVNYTDGTFFTSNTNVVRFEVSDVDPDVADPTSATPLLVIPQPETNHNGGQIFFDPDGYLMIATGDGGGANDDHGTCGNGIILTSPLGKLLRIDVNGIDPNGTAPDAACFGAAVNYTVPTSNPFVDGAGGDCDEIWAYGLRNPWRSTYDAATGDLYIGDVGQLDKEEIDFAAAPDAARGAIFGWRVEEGDDCFDATNQCGPSCGDPSLEVPIVSIGRSDARSITGGEVYRGCLIDNLQGTYFYGDFETGIIRSFEVQGGVAVNQVDWTTQLDPLAEYLGGLTSFGANGRGEMFFADRSNAVGGVNTGSIAKLLPLLEDMSVSAPGSADQFLLGSSSWTWQDFEREVQHPVDLYRIYRGVPNGDFSCVFQTSSTSWVGDAAVPNPGEVFSYLVTSTFGGSESSPGEPEAARNLLPGGC